MGVSTRRGGVRTTKPSSAACDRNSEPILAQLNVLIERDDECARKILEIGSGTGQHAVYFSGQLQEKNIVWQCSDIADNLPGIQQWLNDESGEHCPPAFELDLINAKWLPNEYDYVFTANTLHIVSWPLVKQFFEGVSVTLKSAGLCIVYGPFNYANEYTSDSNRVFDGWLKQRDRMSGIRDIEAVEQLAQEQNVALELVDDIAMPANNRLLVFRKY